MAQANFTVSLLIAETRRARGGVAVAWRQGTMVAETRRVLRGGLPLAGEFPCGFRRVAVSTAASCRVT